MIKLKRGILASSSAAFFQGIVNWLIGSNAGKLFASEDGQNFQEVKSPFGSSNVNDVFYGPDLSSPGNNTFLAAGNDGKLAKSSDGLSWSTINTSQSTAIETIGFGNNTYYIGGV
jgi:hypothetical protein